MFEGLVHYRKVSRLIRKRRAWELTMNPKIKAASIERDWKANEKLYAEWRMDDDMYEDEIAELEMSRLRELSARYQVPLPPQPFADSTNWIASTFTGRARLRPDVMHEMRAKIRRERKERREMWLPYISAIAAFVSVCGALFSAWHGLFPPVP